MSSIGSAQTSRDGNALGNAAEVIVRAKDVDLPLVAAASPVEQLRVEAERSQEPIVDYVERTEGLEVANRFWLANALLLTVDTNTTDLTDLVAQDGVEDVHANLEVSTPTPTGFEPTNTGETDVTYGLDQLNVPAVWEAYDTHGEGATVAVLDTGIDVSHPDLDLYTDDPGDQTYPGGWAEFDHTGGKVEGSEPHDSDWHGTHVSGTVGGGAASGTHVGVAPSVDLLHGMVLPHGSGTFAQIIGGMEWAIEAGADIINMSLGVGGQDPAFIEPVENARTAGVTVVASAGNSGDGSSSSPGNIYSGINVGASTEAAEIADFSSGDVITTDAWGEAAPEDWPAEYVVPDIAAPGAAVLSTLPTHEAEDYGVASGTSMAAPHVAGMLALGVSAGSARPPPVLNESLESTAWQPTDDGYPNTRYGHGIVDAKAAVDELLDSGGIEGMVTDDTGTAVSGAEISPAGVDISTSTETDGTYQLYLADGSYEIVADGFGYQPASHDVTIDSEALVTLDFELEPALDVAVATEQPDALEAGESFEITLEGANVETVLVEQVGTYDPADAALVVDGTEAAFGEPIPVDDPAGGNLSIVVETEPNTEGEIKLEHTVAGLDDDRTVTSGDTTVFDEILSVGVVGMPTELAGTAPSASMVDELRERLPINYEVTMIETGDALELVDEFDAFVMHTMLEDRHPDFVREFVATTRTASVGVVYLEGLNHQANSVMKYGAATGAPTDFSGIDYFFLPGPISYHIDRSHPIFDGVGEPGDVIPLFAGSVSTLVYFEGYPGTTLANIGTDGFIGFNAEGQGIAVDDPSRSVFLASVGHQVDPTGGTFGGDEYAEPTRQLLENAVTWASQSKPVSIIADQPRHVTTGDSAAVTMGVDELSRVTVELNESSTLSPEDLMLSINGADADFGRQITYDTDPPAELEIEVTPEPSATGTVLLDYDIVADGRQFTGTTGPTTVYDPPLHVPDDLPTVQDAVDAAPPGAEIVLADGVYRESVEVRRAGTDGVRIRAAGEATPQIVDPDRSSAPTVQIRAYDVTFEGIDVDAGGLGPAVRVAEGIPSGARDAGEATIRNATLTGAEVGLEIGDLLGAETADRTVVDDVTVLDTLAGDAEVMGIQIMDSQDVQIVNSTLEGIAVGIDVQFARDGATIVDNEIHATTGIQLEVSRAEIRGNRITQAETAIDLTNAATIDALSGNEITDTTTGVHLRGEPADSDSSHLDSLDENTITDVVSGIVVEGDATVRQVSDNTIEASETGVAFAPVEYSHGDDVQPAIEELDGNTVHANVGIDLEETATGTVHHNDFSGSDRAVVAETVGDAVIDARLNYLGDRTYDEPIVEGDVVYDPFLTAPPNKVADEPTQFGTDLYLDAGEAYALGVPGPTDLTIWDVLGDDFHGNVSLWNPNAMKWQSVTGNGQLEQIETLQAFQVEPDVGTRAVLDFQRDEDVPPGPPGTPPGLRDDEPGLTELQEGWNVVAPPRYGPASDVFDANEIDQIDDLGLEEPRNQVGSTGSTMTGESIVSPFVGYLVHADAPAELSGGIDAFDPTVDDFYDGLDIEPTVVSTNQVVLNDLTVDDFDPQTRVTLTAEVAAETASDQTDDLETISKQATAAARAVDGAHHLSHDEIKSLVRDAVEEITSRSLGALEN